MSFSIIFFDGVCNLCNSTIQFLIKQDVNKQFKFASLQSETGQKFLQERELSDKQFNSIIFYEPNQAYYTKSTAALKIAQKLGFPFNLAQVLYILPSFIRDWGYSLIANNRYRWFGKKESCMIPTPESKDRFLP
ncbi:thiol-disulfide oxidoreductase DCC family protein [Apibacter raozihei]|uniref:thiol-disulfide oxidoreductase DCC family protein n=1 Tax=Apibacter raozihei TaxID=2500547 RepID=UPI000FE3F109|nr:thiol-disulfide oxidoreductase DCC family protein [Apibacter raozihei]